MCVKNIIIKVNKVGPFSVIMMLLHNLPQQIEVLDLNCVITVIIFLFIGLNHEKELVKDVYI